MAIFNSYVKLPEGIPSDKSQMHSLDAGISAPWKHTTKTAALDEFLGVIFGGFHSHGGTQIAGFISWKIHQWMRTGGSSKN